MRAGLTVHLHGYDADSETERRLFTIPYTMESHHRQDNLPMPGDTFEANRTVYRIVRVRAITGESLEVDVREVKVR